MSALADGETSQNKRKGRRVVKSRYLQYDKKGSSKNSSTKSFLSSTSSSSSAARTSSLLSQKSETAGLASGLLNQSSFEKGDLQSTLLDGDKITRPDLDLSAINDKAVRQKATSPKASCKTDKGTCVNKQKSKNNPVVVGAELGSQELILTYLGVKMELLSPLVPLLGRFKEQYKSFAVALDATRHKLPIKNIHIDGDMPTYLDKLQEQLTVTQELLAEVMPDSSEESAKAFSELQDTEDVFKKLEKELQRSFTQVQNLSYEASKEVSLHNQRICEDNHGVEVVKHWYFN